MININEIQEITSKVNALAAEVQAMDTKVSELEIARLAKILEIVKSGLKYKKIAESAVISSVGSDTYEYFNKLKGVKVTYKLMSYTDSNSVTGTDVERQLYLLTDGNLAEFEYTNRWSRWQGSSDTHTRELIKTYPLTELDFTTWDADEIMQGIQKALESRLAKLGDRCKTQKDRLEKLQGLQIKR